MIAGDIKDTQRLMVSCRPARGSGQEMELGGLAGESGQTHGLKLLFRQELSPELWESGNHGGPPWWVSLWVQRRGVGGAFPPLRPSGGNAESQVQVTLQDWMKTGTGAEGARRGGFQVR